MRVRLLTAAALAALAVTGLAACDSKVGQAADVNGHKISDTTVSSYITRQGSTSTTAFTPRVQVLDELLDQAVFEDMLTKSGRKIPSDSVLNTKYGAQVAQQFGTRARLVATIKPYGLKPQFADLLVRVSELSLATLGTITTRAQFNAFLAKYEPPVSVSPRYGTWNAKKLTLAAGTHAGVPGFIKLLPTTAPTAAALPGS